MVMIQETRVPVYLRKVLRFVQPLRHNHGMDIGALNLFLKMIEEEYKLRPRDLQRVTERLLADDAEFEKVLKIYRTKARRSRGGNDDFRAILQELLTP